MLFLKSSFWFNSFYKQFLMHSKSFNSLKVAFIFFINALFTPDLYCISIAFPLRLKKRCHLFTHKKYNIIFFIHLLLSSTPASRTGRDKILLPVSIFCFCNEGIHPCQSQNAPACGSERGFLLVLCVKAASFF